MQFLYPSFLWALTALSIPIILHLFYFRRYKKVYFSNLRFLREVKEETSARNRLRNLLILLARLLAMAFIILAFAQPYIPAADSQGSGIRNVSLFVDNSFSMQSFGEDLSLFDRARAKAREIILGYNQEDRFQILGHELSASQHLWLSRDEAITRLEEMDYTPSVKPISIVLGRQKQSFAREDGTPVSWLLSDFQRSILDVQEFDTSFQINLLPLKSVREKNVAIDSVWFESPVQTLNQSTALLFSIHNYSPEDAENIRVTLSIDGQTRPEGTIDLAEGEIKIDTAHITVLKTGWHRMALLINDFPVTFDDSYFFSFYVEETLNVLSINENTINESIRAVFANQSQFDLNQTTPGSLAYASFPEYDLVILNGLSSLSTGLISTLNSYVRNGGKVLFIPAADGQLAQYNQLLSSMGAAQFQNYSKAERRVGTVNTESFIYRDVFIRTRPNMRLPQVKESFVQSGSGSRGQSLLTFRDGGDLATFYTPGKGAFAVVSSPLDPAVNDLSLQPEIFVPLLYKMAIYTSDFRQIAYTIGKDQLVSVDGAVLQPDEEISVTGAIEFIPGIASLGSTIMLDLQDQIKKSGFYEVTQESRHLASLGFNYDRAESDLALVNENDFPSGPNVTLWTGDEERNFTQLIEETQQGKPLWKWCIVLALFFIGVEIALIRLWKNI